MYHIAYSRTTTTMEAYLVAPNGERQLLGRVSYSYEKRDFIQKVDLLNAMISAVVSALIFTGHEVSWISA